MNLIFIFPNLLPSLLSYVPGLTKVQAVDDHLKDRHRILNLLKDNLVQAQSRMKKNADLKRIDKEFSVGDWVYLRLQPYRQTSLALQRAINLGPRFYGPYQILERVGTVAYRLDLPSTSKIHPVFYVSYLKQHLGSLSQAQDTLPSVDNDQVIQPCPERVLEENITRYGPHEYRKLLIQ